MRIVAPENRVILKTMTNISLVILVSFSALAIVFIGLYTRSTQESVQSAANNFAHQIAKDLNDYKISKVQRAASIHMLDEATHYIFITGLFAPRMNALVLTVAQIATVAVLSTIAMLMFEQPVSWPPTGQPLFAALFTGLLATALAFGLQTSAQRFTTATHTALIFATEPVFAALASFVLIGELLGPTELLGSALILAGMLAAELGPGSGE